MNARHRILSEIARSPAGAGELYARLQLPRGTVDGWLGKMVRSGLLQRLRLSAKSSEVRKQRVRHRGHVYDFTSPPGTYEIAP